jgi:hypothetical protein
MILSWFPLQSDQVFGTIARPAKEARARLSGVSELPRYYPDSHTSKRKHQRIYIPREELIQSFIL